MKAFVKLILVHKQNFILATLSSAVLLLSYYSMDLISAQSNNTQSQGNNLLKNDLDTYDNETFGISIQYPAGWVVSEQDIDTSDSVTDIALFAPSYDHILNPLMEGTILIGVSLDTLPRNMTINDYSKNVTNLFTINGLTEIHSNNTVLAGNPAYENLYAVTIPDGNKTLQVWEKGIVVDNRIYILSYSSEPNVFEKYRPLLNKVEDSLRIYSPQFTLAPPKEGTSTYINEKFGFELKYPTNWQTVENVRSSLGIEMPATIETPVAFSARPESRFDNETENIVIAIVSVPSTLSLDEFVKGNLQYMEENSKTFKLIDSYDTTLSGIPAHTIVDKRGPELSFPKSVQISQTYLVHDAKGYIITYTAHSHYDKYLQEAQNIIKSFKLT